MSEEMNNRPEVSPSLLPAPYVFKRSEDQSENSLTGVMPETPEISAYAEFEIEQAQISEIIKKRAGTRLMAPMGLTEDMAITKQYVPFWIFDLEANGDMCVEAKGYKFTLFRNHAQIYDMNIEGTFKAKNIAVDASQTMDDALMDELEPFDFTKLRPYSEGIVPRNQIVENDTSFEACCVRAEKLAQIFCARELTKDLGDNRYVEVNSKKTLFTVNTMTARLVLLPVYSVICHAEGRYINLFINGQTGEVVGWIPYTKHKHILFGCGALMLFVALMQLIATTGVFGRLRLHGSALFVFTIILSFCAMLWLICVLVKSEQAKLDFSKDIYGVHYDENELASLKCKKELRMENRVSAVCAPNGLVKGLVLPILFITRGAALIMYVLPTLIMSGLVVVIPLAVPGSLIAIPIALVLYPLMRRVQIALEKLWFIRELVARTGRLPLFISTGDSFHYSSGGRSHSRSGFSGYRSSGSSHSSFSHHSGGGGRSIGGGAGRRR